MSNVSLEVGKKEHLRILSPAAGIASFSTLSMLGCQSGAVYQRGVDDDPPPLTFFVDNFFAQKVKIICF